MSVQQHQQHTISTVVQSVFALRPFHATLAGHVDAETGDELVLINDTHWYWWLVRVQRTTCIGYIPAEFVELPNERVARMNRDANACIPPPGFRLNRQNQLSAPAKKRVRFADSCCYEPTFYDCMDGIPELEQDCADSSDLSDDCASPIREDNPMDTVDVQEEHILDLKPARKENQILQTSFDALHKIDTKINGLIKGLK